MLFFSVRNLSNANDIHIFLVAVVAAVVFLASGVSSVVLPSTSCYVLDNSSYLHDFSNWVGHHFEYDDSDPDLVVRFCKDVETRSQRGYVDFGRFYNFNHFVASSGPANFIQGYFNGDLGKCETSFDKMGRTAQVNIICGDCPNGQCKGGPGCICNVTYESTCRVLVDLAMHCEKPALRVFQGFTVGFHPRSWEIVYNGMTQLGYEKVYNEFSFRTEQKQVTLYMTAVASLSDLVRKPKIKISPAQGLHVRLSGTGATGTPPTTLSPTMLVVDWRCEKARDTPYKVEITIPIEKYDPIQFTLAKFCQHSQGESEDATRGWTVFGIFSCVFIVVFTLFCCGGFIYKTRVENQRGLDALPGMTILSACLETVSGEAHSYTRPEDTSSPFVNQVSQEREQITTRGSHRVGQRNYGAI